MQFNRLNIERIRWGDDAGQITATLEVENGDAKMEVRMGDEAARSIMVLCADMVASSASKQAEAFRRKFLDAVTNGDDKGNASH